MRKRVTYANVAATLALVFAMTGGALAANHYLISSTKQISPKVLKKLKGARGATGPAGAPGKAGADGKEGKEGKEGKTGAPGTARAYAVIATNGTLDKARSKNIAKVEKVSTGIYCIALSAAAEASSSSVTGVVTPDAHGTETTFQEHLIGYSESVPNSCEEGKLEVVMRAMKVEGGLLKEENDDAGFVLVVP